MPRRKTLAKRRVQESSSAFASGPTNWCCACGAEAKLRDEEDDQSYCEECWNLWASMSSAVSVPIVAHAAPAEAAAAAEGCASHTDASTTASGSGSFLDPGVEEAESLSGSSGPGVVPVEPPVTRPLMADAEGRLAEEDWVFVEPPACCATSSLDPAPSEALTETGDGPDKLAAARPKPLLWWSVF
mmetsp:Transcript_122609/g.261662  ORF Transcript_122609/g.261662 Transcript_122609/m.261662 type:complete len:186 (+) Transcript_122609:84-641(+)